MGLNETQINNLKKLDAIEGTGVFSYNIKVDSIDQPTVIISLGGLGGKTLSKLKKEINHRINQENISVRLLAIDSNDNAVESLVSYGNLTSDEILSLYIPEIHSAFKDGGTFPDYIEKWLNPNLDPFKSHIMNRQVVRLLLALPPVYHKVRNKLKEIILEAREASPLGRLNIILISGVSGGTGGVLLLDIAYLLRDVIECELGNGHNYKLFAQIYMPDVQFGCRINEDVLKAYSYPALKEIDYFMNIEKTNGEYEWPFEEGSVKNKQRNVFDNCIIISSENQEGINPLEQLKESIDIAVESLMTLITNQEWKDVNGCPCNIISWLDDGMNEQYQQWRIYGNGSDYDKFPLSANYCYSIIGYGSAKIPVDAIMSYIALKMYENMLYEYQNMNNLDTDTISKLMTSVGTGDIDTIINAVKEYSQYSYSPLELPSGRDIHNVNNKYKTWRDRAIEHYITYKNTQLFSKAIDKVTASIVSAFDTKLNIIFSERGPYFVSKLITASYAGDGVDGILRKIDALIKTMNEEYDKRIERCNTTDRLIAALDQKAADVPAIFSHFRDESRDMYIFMAKATIEKFTVEMEILARMQDKLIEVRNYLVDSNNKVFDVYTNVLDHIKGILAKNSDLVVKSNRTSNSGGGETYSLDVVNLDAAQENGRRLKACLDSFLTPEFLDKFKDSFEELLRAPENRPAFTDTTDKFNATNLIQKLFDELLGKFYGEAVERFLIAYYSNNQDMDNIDKLDSVMNNEAEKKKTLMLAADEICRSLKAIYQIRCGIMNGSIEEFMTPRKYLIVPPVLKEYFLSAVKKNFDGSVCVCTRDNSFSIEIFTFHEGIPLTSIKGIEKLDKVYDDLVQNNHIGIHLDEGSNSNFRLFPMPFVKEAWKFVEGHRSRTEEINIRFVEELTDKLVSYNLISYDTIDKTRINMYFEADVTKELTEKFKKSLNELGHTPNDRVEFIRNFLEENGVSISVCPIELRGCCEFINSIDNVSNILRKNITLLVKVKEFIKKYEIFNDIIENTYFTCKTCVNLMRIYEPTELFLDLIKTGILKYEPNFRIWNYIDGQTTKVFYNFAMKENFVSAYNLYFVFAEYILNTSEELKYKLNDIVKEKLNKRKTEYDFPVEIKRDIENLFCIGSPWTSIYRLDRELNRISINESGKDFSMEFTLPYQRHSSKDNFDILRNFYIQFKNLFS